MKAPFGWTVVAKGGDPKRIVVYRRDRPADKANWAEDLAPHTYPSEKKAREAGKQGFFAYGGKVPGEENKVTEMDHPILVSRIMSENKKLQTFFYHPEGQDNNGNFGPSPTDPGWIAVVGRTAEEAAEHLPAPAKKKLMKEVNAFRKEQGEPTIDILEACAQTCTWGWKCSFMDQVNWDNFLENEEDVEAVDEGLVISGVEG